MGISNISSLLLSILIFSLLQRPIFSIEKSYIVYLGAHSHDPQVESVDFDSVRNSHYNLLGSLLGSNEKAKDQIFYSYTNYINGFAAILDEDVASQISKHPSVVSVFPNDGVELHTTRSWDFLGLERNGETLEGSIWKKARYGEDIIIGNIDTGVWPESKSFNDEAMGPIPSKWKGICEQDTTKQPVHCNKKLIGARYFSKAYAAYAAMYEIKLNSSINTARDFGGHGTHTLSIAGGNFVPQASLFGHGNGTAKGGSPKARVAAYKVCWPPIDGISCFQADVLAGFDAAISDGVDVLSVSFGLKYAGLLNDAIATGAFHAVEKGVVVVASAGNRGPYPKTVRNAAPWLITVGASTIDRKFTSYVTLGSNKTFEGVSLSEKGLPSEKFYPLISGEQAKSPNASALDAHVCDPESLDPEKVKGKILVCVQGGRSYGVTKGLVAKLAGAVGMIFANERTTQDKLIPEAHLLPTSNINETDGLTLLAYLNSTKTPTAYITPVKTVLGTKPAPYVAFYSSRGPCFTERTLLKPDIIAPGDSILAAFSQAIAPTFEDYDKRRVPFTTISGTSVSCPHISGIAGLIKTMHPTWSPAAIKSAIMTTASTQDNTNVPLQEQLSPHEKATPLTYGAGHVQPNRAMDPGLIYDLSTHDYMNYLCATNYTESQIKLVTRKSFKCPKSYNLPDFNYPSITVRDIKGPKIITRVVTNVGTPGTYKVRVKTPERVYVAIYPTELTFKSVGEKKTFEILMTPRGKAKYHEDFVFGELIWSDGKHYVRSPIAVTLYFEG